MEWRVESLNFGGGSLGCSLFVVLGIGVVEVFREWGVLGGYGKGKGSFCFLGVVDVV